MPDSQTQIANFAQSLDPRPCIAWALACIRKLRPDPSPLDQAALQAIDKWLAEPTDENRRAAKLAAEEAELSTPAACIAMAVFFAEGSIAPPDQKEVPPPPHVAQKIAGGAVQLAVVDDPAKSAERSELCLQLGREPSAPAA